MDFTASQKHDLTWTIDLHGSTVSIRGDFRDYIAAGQIFPRWKRHFSGWDAFWARRIGILDLPFRLGILPIINRYERWARALNIPWEPPTRWVRPTNKGPLKIIVHLGAQWRSKQYPYVEGLIELLRKHHHNVRILAGPGDFIFEPLQDQVARVSGPDLVTELQNCDLFIGNDSGPMHLSFAMGRSTVALVGITGIQEWVPPGVLAISRNPRSGYKPRRNYATDQLVLDTDAWLSPEEVVNHLKGSGLDGC